jgi:hypothetical protein
MFSTICRFDFKQLRKVNMWSPSVMSLAEEKQKESLFWNIMHSINRFDEK